MERIFKYSDTENIVTPDKELNILTYAAPSYVIVYMSYTPLKWFGFRPTL